MRAQGRKLPQKPDEDFPDSTFPYGPCPRCRRLSNFEVVGQAPVTYADRFLQASSGGLIQDFDEQVSILRCAGCKQNSVVVEEKCVGGHAVSGRQSMSGGVIQWRGVHWYPSPGTGSVDTDVPQPIADAIAEGARCLAVRAPRAAVVMFRGALGEMVIDRGSQAARAKNSLAAQLRQMNADGDLDRALADWADHVRLLGNAGAHPGELDPVTDDEAADLRRLITSIIDYLYITPARVQRARTARP